MQPTPPPVQGCFFCTTVQPLLSTVWSKATGDHFKNAGVEFLKGIRCLIDLQISMMSRGGAAAESKGTHLNVE